MLDYLMLDLCAGLGGASAAMRERGWRVITLDADPAYSGHAVMLCPLPPFPRPYPYSPSAAGGSAIE